MASRPTLTLKTQADWDRLQTPRGQVRLNRVPTPVLHVQGDIHARTDISNDIVIEGDAQPNLTFQNGARPTIAVRDNAQPYIVVKDHAAPDITFQGGAHEAATVVVDNKGDIFSRRPHITTRDEAKPGIVLRGLSIVSCEDASAPVIGVFPTANADIHWKGNARPTVVNDEGSKHATLSGAGRLLTRSTGKSGADWTVERPFHSY